MGKRMNHQLVVGVLKEHARRRRFVTPARRPVTDPAESGQHRSVRLQKESMSALRGPCGKLITSSFNLIAYFLYAKYQASRIVSDKPFPESRTEIKAVVKILCLYKNIGVEQVCHQKSTPRLRPSSLKVSSLVKPSIRKASRCSVCPSSVLAMRARAKRLLTRAAWVR